VLYSQNCFSFAGARGPIRFHALLSSQNWQLLRHLHISTMFRTSLARWSILKSNFPPERLEDWQECCRTLETLSLLQMLKVEMVIWTEYGEYNPAEPAENDIIAIFRPMLEIQAETFDVEVNFPFPQYLDDALGFRPFQIIVHERPYDWETFAA